MSVENETNYRQEKPTSISPELRKLRSEIITKRWQDPIARENTILSISQAIKAKWEDPAYRKKASKASSKRMKAKWEDPAYQSRLSEVHRAKWSDPEYKKRRQSPDRALWEFAQENGLIEQVISNKKLTQAEINKLNKFFSSGNNRRQIEDLLEKFSIAIANLA